MNAPTPPERTHWTFIGAGNMAASLVGGWLAGGGRADTIALVDPHAEARERARARLGVAVFEALATVPVPPPDTLRGFVIAVKPDIVKTACHAIAEASPDARTSLVVSVAAGVRLDALAHWLAPGTPIVRCMPNTPSLLGLGAIGLYANTLCDERRLERAEALLASAGTTVRVPEEQLLDAVTALSGSGPAYVFYLTEHMAAAGERLGLAPDIARTLAVETLFGAASMVRAGEDPPAELRRRVTSKGGTTAAAIAAFDEAGLADIVLRAMSAAHARAGELGDEHSPA